MKGHVGGGNETLLWEEPSWTNAGEMTSLLGGHQKEYNRLETVGLFIRNMNSQVKQAVYSGQRFYECVWLISRNVDKMDFKELSVFLNMIMFCLFDFYLLKGFAIQIVLQPITVLLTQKTRTRWSAKQMLWVRLNPCWLSPSPWSQTHTPWDCKSVPIVLSPCWAKAWELCGVLGALCLLKGITVRLWNKEGGMNLILPLCHTNSHVFHTLSALLPLTLTSPPCANIFWRPPHPNVTSALEGIYWVA